MNCNGASRCDQNASRPAQAGRLAEGTSALQPESSPRCGKVVTELSPMTVERVTEAWAGSGVTNGRAPRESDYKQEKMSQRFQHSRER